VLTLALVLVVVGLHSVFYPRASIVVHQSGKYGRYIGGDALEVISPKMAVVYGAGTVGLGAIAFLCALAWPKWHEEEEKEKRRWHGSQDEPEKE